MKDMKKMTEDVGQRMSDSMSYEGGAELGKAHDGKAVLERKTEE